MTASSDDAPRVIFTDDGWILSATEPPLTVEKLKAEVVDSHAWPGGALWWSIGDHEVYHYETEIGEIIGEAIEGLDEGTYSFVHSGTPGVIGMIAQNVRALMDECGGPVTALGQAVQGGGATVLPTSQDEQPLRDRPAQSCLRTVPAGPPPTYLSGSPAKSLPWAA